MTSASAKQRMASAKSRGESLRRAADQSDAFVPRIFRTSMSTGS